MEEQFYSFIKRPTIYEFLLSLFISRSWPHIPAVPWSPDSLAMSCRPKRAGVCASYACVVYTVCTHYTIHTRAMRRRPQRAQLGYDARSAARVCVIRTPTAVQSCDLPVKIACVPPRVTHTITRLTAAACCTRIYKRRRGGAAAAAACALFAIVAILCSLSGTARGSSVDDNDDAFPYLPGSSPLRS